jgi:hypothetical protein
MSLSTGISIYHGRVCIDVEEKQKMIIFVVVGVRILMNVELFRVYVEMEEDV